MHPIDDFDLDRYLRVSKRVDLSSVAWDRIREHRLDPAEARVLRYMMDIESHTVVFLRDLLATRAAVDPDVSAFLSCWVYEELWHGEAFSRFLGEAGYRLAPDRLPVGTDDAYPSRVDRNRWIRRARAAKGAAAHLGTMLGSAASKDFVAIHMTWGAANELTTLTAYHRLIATTQHPQLIRMLRAIIKDERRHFAFYRAQSRQRLARSTAARRMTRWAMEHLWAPVGTGVRPQWDTDFVAASLFGTAEGRQALFEMQATMCELPGLGGTTFLVDAVRDAVTRTNRRSAGAASLQWKIDGEPRPGGHGALQADSPAEMLDDPLGQWQAEARAGA